MEMDTLRIVLGSSIMKAGGEYRFPRILLMVLLYSSTYCHLMKYH